MRPRIDGQAGIYTLRWDDPPVVASVDRLSEDGHHAVSAEVTVRTELPGVAPHLHQARLTLTSTVARRTWAKLLEERAPQLADWYAVVEQLCLAVLEREREGEPAIDLAQYQPPEASRWRLEPVLLENHVNLLFGEGGVGKTLLAQYMGVLVATGYAHNGLTPEPGRVGYLDWESEADDCYERLELLAAGLDVPVPQVIYRRCSLPLADDLPQIQRLVLERGLDLVIVDSGGLACGGDMWLPAPTNALFRALRQLHIATLVITHTQKHASRKTPYGSAYWWNIPRSIYEVRQARNPGADSFEAGLYHVKANRGKLQSPMGFRFRFGANACSVSPVRVADIPDLEEHLPMRDRLRLALQHGPATAADLAELLDSDENAVRTTLNRHKNVFAKGTGQRLGTLALVSVD